MITFDPVLLYIASIVFASWFGLSIFCQVPGNLSNRIFRYDILGIIPSWKLFVTPMKNDFHLLYRDRFKDETMTEWQIASTENHYHRNYIGAIWNPIQIFDKAKFDLIRDLARYVASVQDDLSSIQQTRPYCVILNYVMYIPRDNGKEPLDTQFMVMMTNGVLSEESPRPLFVSAFHGYHMEN